MKLISFNNHMEDKKKRRREMQVGKKQKCMSLIAKSVEKFARKRANPNCGGLMYEPKRPEKLVRK